jgi:hypothetical protein
VTAIECVRSMILGKAKVMSFEALEEARAKRAAKEAAAAEKGVQVRKRKSPATKTGVPGSTVRGQDRGELRSCEWLRGIGVETPVTHPVG